MTDVSENSDAPSVVIDVIDPSEETKDSIRSVFVKAAGWEDRVRSRLAAASLLEPGAVVSTVRALLFGPGAGLETIEEAHDEDAVAVIALVSADEPAKRNRLIDKGLDEVVSWPASEEELICRTAVGIERGMTRRAREVERRDVEGLLDLSDALTTTLDIESTLFLIAKRMAEVLKSERCSVILLDERSEYGFVVATSDDRSIRNHLIPVASNYPEILEVIRTGEPLVIEDVKRDPLFDDVRELIQDKPVGNTALFPVRIEGRVEGVLHLRGADVRPGGLSKRHLRLGTIVANATAIAVRNARLYQSIRDRAERVLSARVKAERKTRQLEKYQRFFDLSGDGIIIVDGRGRIVFANREAQSLLGFEASDITQVGLTDIVQEEDASRVGELLEHIREGRDRQQLDLSVIRTTGEVAVLSLSTASLEPEGEPVEQDSEIATIISLRDVTLTRRIERELRETKEFLENLIESSGDAIVAADMEGTILIFNGVAEALTGYGRKDVVGKMSVVNLYDEGVARRIGRSLKDSSQGAIGRYQSSRENLVCADGTRIPISLTAALLFDRRKSGAKREIATMGVFSDLREQIRMEERLDVAQRKLEMSERQAGAVELAGAAAHELSQPLTAILGNAELLERKLKEDDPMLRSIRKIIGECERMHEIVKKIGQITEYRTKPYLGSTNIVDLDAASETGEKR